MDPLKLQRPLRRVLRWSILAGAALLLVQFGLHRVEVDGGHGDRERLWVLVDRLYAHHRGLSLAPGDGALLPGDQVLYRPPGVARRAPRLGEVLGFPVALPEGRGVRVQGPEGRPIEVPLDLVVGRVIAVI